MDVVLVIILYGQFLVKNTGGSWENLGSGMFSEWARAGIPAS